MSLTAIAIISVIMAILFYQFKYGDGSSLQGAGASVDELDELDDELDD
ncbi:MAG: hypothetical protein ACLSBH_17520 [Coprobacillus cateniformis]